MFTRTLVPKSPKVLVVNEALDDIRFRNNSLVTGPPYIRFYAGTPLILKDGSRVGSLCIIDQQPHHDFDAQVCGLLLRLATWITWYATSKLSALNWHWWGYSSNGRFVVHGALLGCMRL